MALSRANRLSLRLHRDRLTRTGQTFYGRFFTVVSASQNEEINVPRYAILVSKKTASLATDRNYIKRLTSSLLQSQKTVPPRDYLIIPKHQVLNTSFLELKTDLQKLLK